LTDYYHVRITRISNRSSDCLELDLTEDNLLANVVGPYKAGKKFLCGGTIVDPLDIESIQINKTPEPSSEYLPIIRARNAASGVVSMIPDEWEVTEEGEVVTRKYINVAPGTQSETAVHEGVAGNAQPLTTKPITEMDHNEFMKNAIEVSKNSVPEDERVHPRVGAILVKDGKVVETAFRGEIAKGNHAEFVLLERKLPAEDLSNATLYTTLEPCTSRTHKTPCTKRIIERRLQRVVIGMLDPNPTIHGGSVPLLKDAGIEVVFGNLELEKEIKELNKQFIQAQPQRPESVSQIDPVAIAHRCVQERWGRDVRIIRWQAKPLIEVKDDRIVVSGIAKDDRQLDHLYSVPMRKDGQIIYDEVVAA